MSTQRYGKAPIAIGFGLIFAVLSAVPVAMMNWDRAVRAGRVDYSQSKQMDVFFRTERTGAPLVLAIGDSTLRPPIPFPVQMGAHLKKAVEVRTFWGPGLSPAEAALVLSKAIELRPAMIILLAHIATFEAGLPLRYPGLVNIVPPRRLPDLLTMPYFSRGVGAGELISASLGAAIMPRSWLLAFTGGADFVERRLENRFSVIPGTLEHKFWLMDKNWETAILRSAERLYPDHPSVAMLRGSVRMAERQGIEVLVVVSPINQLPLRKFGEFNPEDLEARVKIVMDAVESEGGDVIDMHRALPQEEFKDDVGHYTSTAAHRISIPVEDWTRGVLKLPPRTRKDMPVKR